MTEYDYELPAELLARYPSDKRGDSKLLVVDRRSGELRHRRFSELVDLMSPGDLLVVNDTKVLPARLVGRKPTGAAAEVLLLAPALGEGESSRVWEALVRPGGKLKAGRSVEIGPELTVHIEKVLPNGNRLVRLEGPLQTAQALRLYGRVPLPPYLGRDAEPIDEERYQTVYAESDGSVAAPTAGLHFTPALLAKLEARGVERAEVTLHVGVGTFRPLEAENPADHVMHEERYTVPENTARAIEACKNRGGRIWAVGTTVVRTLESVAVSRVRAGTTRLFIRPPYDFKVVDGLITNFHLPRSTLLMLVSALGGGSVIRKAYEEAIEHRYRFYSYGDAMVVLP
ncbi:MAG: tRNA preQ1(34) S-adenosylmethionine ribosyltransferase-isomerase QueA [Longimicrobiales bacterium]